MSEIVIKSENLGKSYMIGHQNNDKYIALRDVITNNAKRLWSRIKNPQYHTHQDLEEFWALKDINFEVKQGESVGIIGRNGAGKSTLLKVLSRITDPTTGRVTIKGRVASLLEVGTGFHPELTGRENIFLNGAILGMTRHEVKRKFDEIVDFAEIEKFLDTPVKRYSSGMYVRLAFAVAAHLEPEILIVDEVLAVGDTQFQKKCLDRMGHVAKEGRTVLFVSHNMGAIRQLCSRVVHIENGSVKSIGDVSTVVNEYLECNINSKKNINLEFSADVNESLIMQVVKARIYTRNDISIPVFDVFDPISIEIGYTIKEIAFGYSIYCEFVRNGEILFVSFDSSDSKEPIEERLPGYYKTTADLPVPFLKPGNYTINIMVGRPNTPPIQTLKNILQFEIDLLSKPSAFASYAKHRAGVVVAPLTWITRCASSQTKIVQMSQKVCPDAEQRTDQP